MAAASNVWSPICPKTTTSSKATKVLILAGRVAFTTAGAVDTTNSKTPQVTPSKQGGTGLYRLTFPPAKNIFITYAFQDTSGGIFTATGKAVTASTGVCDVTIGDGAAAADAASGDFLDYIAYVEC